MYFLPFRPLRPPRRFPSTKNIFYFDCVLYVYRPLRPPRLNVCDAAAAAATHSDVSVVKAEHKTLVLLLLPFHWAVSLFLNCSRKTWKMAEQWNVLLKHTLHGVRCIYALPKIPPSKRHVNNFFLFFLRINCHSNSNLKHFLGAYITYNSNISCEMRFASFPSHTYIQNTERERTKLCFFLSSAQNCLISNFCSINFNDRN